jgi:hypothetical protein
MDLKDRGWIPEHVKNQPHQYHIMNHVIAFYCVKMTICPLMQMFFFICFLPNVSLNSLLCANYSQEADSEVCVYQLLQSP